MASQTTTTTTQTQPRLSIGMPLYNAEAYLESALDSLVSQTFTDFELIISDNASTDGTESICRAYAQRDSRILYERQSTNQGANWNFNHVCELARGDLFKWAAHDDLQGPTFLERCVAVFDQDPGVVACHSLSTQIGPDAKPLDQDCDPAGDVWFGTSAKAHRRFGDVLLHHGWGTRCFGLFRRRLLVRSGLFESYYGWEKVMMAHLSLAGRFHLIDEPLFYKRIHPDSLSHQVMESNHCSRRLAMANHYRSAHSLPRLAYIKGYLRVAWSVAPDWGTRLACLGWIAAYLMQVRKLAAMARANLRHHVAPVRYTPELSPQ